MNHLGTNESNESGTKRSASSTAQRLGLLELPSDVLRGIARYFDVKDSLCVRMLSRAAADSTLWHAPSWLPALMALARGDAARFTEFAPTYAGSIKSAKLKQPLRYGHVKSLFVRFARLLIAQNAGPRDARWKAVRNWARGEPPIDPAVFVQLVKHAMTCRAGAAMLVLLQWKNRRGRLIFQTVLENGGYRRYVNPLVELNLADDTWCDPDQLDELIRVVAPDAFDTAWWPPMVRHFARKGAAECVRFLRKFLDRTATRTKGSIPKNFVQKLFTNVMENVFGIADFDDQPSPAALLVQWVHRAHSIHIADRLASMSLHLAKIARITPQPLLAHYADDFDALYPHLVHVELSESVLASVVQHAFRSRPIISIAELEGYAAEMRNWAPSSPLFAAASSSVCNATDASVLPRAMSLFPLSLASTAYNNILPGKLEVFDTPMCMLQIDATAGLGVNGHGLCLRDVFKVLFAAATESLDRSFPSAPTALVRSLEPLRTLADFAAQVTTINGQPWVMSLTLAEQLQTLVTQCPWKYERGMALYLRTAWFRPVLADSPALASMVDWAERQGSGGPTLHAWDVSVV
ncbi:hypothetical protein H9P43_007023 [Blastocladiella emersonii ATCC 22665]|nr:hypothetical protein H9P43_007023 [Blastocladiella emersonii ATCC 22665]